MKAVFLTGIREMEIREAPEPVLAGGNDVLLRVDNIGVCGSDMHYYRTGRIGTQAVEYPWLLGHECAATVVRVGGEVDRVRPGDRVAVDPLIVCHACDQCLAGREHTCRKQRFLGCPGQVAGALAEYLVMPSECCFPVPDSLTMVQATLTEPFAIGLYARRLAGPIAGHKVGILGCGPIGLCVLLAVRAAGPCTTYVTDLLDERLRVARTCGADATGVPTREDIVADFQRAEPLGLDYVFECAGEQETLDQAVALARPGGSVMVVGIPEFDRWGFEADTARRKELRIQHVRRQNRCVQDAIDLAAAGTVNLDPLVTHHFPLEKANEAYEMVCDYRDGVVKAIVHVEA